MSAASILLLLSNGKVSAALDRSLGSSRMGCRVQHCSARTEPSTAAARLVLAYLDGNAGRRVLVEAEAMRAETGVPFIVVARESCEALVVAALRGGAKDYFCEPYDERALLAAVDACLLPETAVAGGPSGLHSIVGNSPEIDGIRRYIARVAATDCNVLITGETGTGKELVAQLIHANSGRAKRPLVCVNCAAIPDSLLESELFGYERGAFTGAEKAQPGRLGMADGGTVFFDEIGDMSLYAQAKILRAIESRQIQRLGAKTMESVDIRIVSATNRDLETMTRDNMFRADLYFRLNVGRIHLPPLRERQEDLAALALEMIHDLNRKMNRNVLGLTDGATATLMQHAWPGNVRELKNMIESVLITRSHGRIETKDLPQHLLRRPLHAVATHLPAGAGEKTQLISALTACQWNKSKAAEKLNWSRMTLYRKLAKYRLLSPDDAGVSGDGSVPVSPPAKIRSLSLL